MLRKTFNTYSSLALQAVENLKKKIRQYEYGYTSCYPKGVIIAAFYEQAVELATELVKSGCKIEDIDLHASDHNGYGKEYYLTVSYIDGQITLWVESAYCDELSTYLKSESDILYIFSDCNCKIISKIDFDTVYETYVAENGLIDQEDDTNYALNDCGMKDINTDSCNDVDNQHGFSMTKYKDNHSVNISFYATDNDLTRNMMDYCKSFFLD